MLLIFFSEYVPEILAVLRASVGKPAVTDEALMIVDNLLDANSRRQQISQMFAGIVLNGFMMVLDD